MRSTWQDVGDSGDREQRADGAAGDDAVRARGMREQRAEPNCDNSCGTVPCSRDLTGCGGLLGALRMASGPLACRQRRRALVTDDDAREKESGGRIDDLGPRVM